MNMKQPNTNPPHQFFHHSHHQLLKWSSWFLPLSGFLLPAGIVEGSICTYSKKTTPSYPSPNCMAHIHTERQLSSIMQKKAQRFAAMWTWPYIGTTCTPYGIVSHTWVQIPQSIRCHHHQGYGKHLEFPWGSLRTGHIAGRTFCSRRTRGLQACNINVAVRNNHR